MSLLIVKKGTDFNSSSENLFKSIDHDDYQISLFHNEVDPERMGLETSDYLYLSMAPKLYIEGELTEVLDSLPVEVKGANTFILHDIDENVFDNFKTFYQLGYVNDNPKLVELLSKREATFLPTFIEDYDDGCYIDDDKDIDAILEILNKIVEETGEDYNSVAINVAVDVKNQMMFKKFDLGLKELDSSNTLIAIMDMVELKDYIKYDELFSDELEELLDIETEGEFELAYSTWDDDYNLELFESLEIDNGNYISYPTLYYGDYQIEPETGHWY